MNSSKNHKIRTLWLTGMLHGFTHLYNVALLPLYLLMQRDFKFDSVSQATSFVTVMMMAYFLPSYPLGVLADRASRKTLLTWGLVINALAFMGLAFAPNYAWAMAAVIVAGIGGSSYHPAATAMIARSCPADTGKALGLVGMGAGAGFFFGPLYAGWRATALEPLVGAGAWRRPVLELGIFGLLAAALFAWLASDEKSPSDSERKLAHPTNLFPTSALWFFFVACSLFFSLRDFAGAGMASLGSLFLQKAHGLDAKQAGIALSGLFLASVLGNPLLGSLSDRGRKRWITTVLLIGAVLIVSFPHVSASWTLPCLVAFGFFYMASYPMVEAAVMQSVPDAVRGRVFGFYVTITGLIGNVAHWIAGAQVKRMGETANLPGNYFPLYSALAVLVVLSLAGLPCLHAIRKREHLDKQTAPSQSAIL